MEFFRKVILPITLIGILLLLFKPIYMVGGKVDIFYLWLAVGIPFGMQKMFVWLIPRNHDIGTSIGIIAVNFIVGGLIGGVVAVIRVLQALWYCLKYLRQFIVGKNDTIE